MKYWWPALLLVISVLSASEALAVQKEEWIVKMDANTSRADALATLTAEIQRAVNR